VTVGFISDLHLDPSRPGATAAFLSFLQGAALSLDRLYILGDLFESWIGDDDPDPHHRQVINALADYTRQQPRCFFMAGNRDFMIGSNFLQQTGLLILSDPTVIEIEAKKVLISHGDLYCTDDISYQRFRRLARNPLIMSLYRALPFGFRNRLVSKARSESQNSKQHKTAAIMDVNLQAITQAMREHGVHTMLHGHTHRPQEHQFDLDGNPAMRIVLGDWYTDGPVLYWDDSGRRTERLAFSNS
jgi:UDP-2,3-diacylglucosamine hydrolase